MNRTFPALSETLGEARKMRRMSQLELSMRVGVSQRHMVKLDEVGPTVLAHLRAEASTHPPLTSRVEAFADMLRGRLGAERLHVGLASPTAPVLTTRFATVIRSQVS